MDSKATSVRIAGISLALFALNQLVLGADLLTADKQWLDLCRFDCIWYSSVMEGYDYVPRGNARHDAADWAFFPLWPLFASALKVLFDSTPAEALLVGSKLLFLGAIFCFIRFATTWDKTVNHWVAGLAIAINPYSLYGNTGYSEPLFLLLSAVTFFNLEQRRHTATGVTAALLTASRPVGIAFALPYLITVGRNWRNQKEPFPAILLGFMLIPLGLSLFMVFRSFTLVMRWLSPTSSSAGIASHKTPGTTDTPSIFTTALI